jgi:hypothetical protein
MTGSGIFNHGGRGCEADDVDLAVRSSCLALLNCCNSETRRALERLLPLFESADAFAACKDLLSPLNSEARRVLIPSGRLVLPFRLEDNFEVLDTPAEETSLC